MDKKRKRQGLLPEDNVVTFKIELSDCAKLCTWLLQHGELFMDLRDDNSHWFQKAAKEEEVITRRYEVIEVGNKKISLIERRKENKHLYRGPVHYGSIFLFANA